MFLLNPKYSAIFPNLSSFTFHYVSIKSEQRRFSDASKYNLHSTMFLLNQFELSDMSRKANDLHSTMFLLNPI